MKKTVALVKPLPYPQGSRRDLSTPAYLPLGLLAIAAPLLAAGYKVVVLDEKFDQDIEGQLNNLRDELLAVGITAQTGYEIIGGLRISRYARARLKVPTIWGGWHASTNPAQTAVDPDVDYVVKGQGLQTLLDLIRALEQNSPLSEIPGLLYKVDGQVRENANRPLVDINLYPEPAYELVDVERYIQDASRLGIRITNDIHIKKERFFLYSSSYGCPHRCGYCASASVHGRNIVMLTPEAVGEQLQHLVDRYNVQMVQFIDPNFFHNTARVKGICHEILRRGLNIKFAVGGPRVDQIMRWDDEVLPLLKQSGCIWLGVGSESGSQDVLDYMHKGIKAKDIMTAAGKLFASGIDMTFFFMFGLPRQETRQDLLASFRLAGELKKLYPRILLPMYFYDPYPGTPMYEDALQKGFKAPQSLEEWGHYDPNVSPEVADRKKNVSYVTENMTDLVKRAIVFYLPLAYPADMKLGTLTNVKSYLEKGRFRVPVRWLHRLARLRVERGFYSLPVEWIVFKGMATAMPNRFYKK